MQAELSGHASRTNCLKIVSVSYHAPEEGEKGSAMKNISEHN